MAHVHPDLRRRGLLKALAWIPVLPLAAWAGRALAQSPPPAPGQPAPPPPATTPATPATPGAPATPAAPHPDLAPLTQLLKNRYGKQVTDEQLSAMAPDIERVARLGERLRKSPLKNADEPDFVFRATQWP